MSRQPEDKTAKQEMTSLIKWADTQGFSNIAEALRRVLPFVRDERDYQHDRKKKTARPAKAKH